MVLFAALHESACWPVTSLAVMQQFGRDQAESGHRADIVDRSKMTLVRGRDASYLAPPAQIRTSPIRAYGSHLGCMTPLRDILASCRMCFSACDTVSRYCARPVLC